MIDVKRDLKRNIVYEMGGGGVVLGLLVPKMFVTVTLRC